MKRKNQTALIAFDGVCMLCQSSVHFILKRDTKDYFRFIPLEQIDKHGEWARLLPEKPVDSIVLMENIRSIRSPPQSCVLFYILAASTPFCLFSWSFQDPCATWSMTLSPRIDIAGLASMTNA